MIVGAFDIRTAGPRDYEHAILDIAFVVYGDCGELLDSYSTFLKPSPYRSYRMSDLQFQRVSMKDLNEGAEYDKGLEEFAMRTLELDIKHAGLVWWSLEADYKASFIAKGMANRGHFQIDNVCSINSLVKVLSSLGAIRKMRYDNFSILDRHGATDFEQLPALDRCHAQAQIVTSLLSPVEGRIGAPTTEQPALLQGV